MRGVFNFETVLFAELHDLKQVLFVENAASGVNYFGLIIPQISDAVFEYQLLNLKNLVKSFFAKFPLEVWVSTDDA